MSDNDLLPCPFCGAIPEMIIDGKVVGVSVWKRTNTMTGAGKWTGEIWHYCKPGSIKIGVQVIHKEKRKAEALCALAWNTRRF